MYLRQYLTGSFHPVCHGLLDKFLFHGLAGFVLSPTCFFFFYNVHNKIMHICTYMSVIHSGLLGDTQNVKADKTTELCGTVVKKIK